MTIAVIGETMIDRYLYGEVSRISPEAPVAIVKHMSTMDKPGGAANVFANIKSLMNDVVLSVKCENPPIKMRVFAQNHYVTRIDFNDGGNDWELLDNYRDVEYVVVSHYAKGLFTRLEELPNLPQKTIVDPKLPLRNYKGAWCIKPNKIEFQNDYGKWSDINQLFVYMEAAINDHGFTHLLVTMGEDGIAYGNNEGFFKHFSGHKVDLTDPTGCGDTVISVLAYALHSGYSMVDAIELANKAGSIAVSHAGTYIINPQDLGLQCP